LKKIVSLEVTIGPRRAGWNGEQLTLALFDVRTVRTRMG